MKIIPMQGYSKENIVLQSKMIAGQIYGWIFFSGGGVVLKRATCKCNIGTHCVAINQMSFNVKWSETKSLFLYVSLKTHFKFRIMAS